MAITDDSGALSAPRQEPSDEAIAAAYRLRTMTYQPLDNVRVMLRAAYAVDFGSSRQEPEGSSEEAIARANQHAREWKLLFLAAMGVTDPWAVTTWSLASAERALRIRSTSEGKEP